jgi:hypothetical protein
MYEPFLLSALPYLAFPRILGGSGPLAWVVLLAIVAFVGSIAFIFYRILREE